MKNIFLTNINKVIWKCYENQMTEKFAEEARKAKEIKYRKTAKPQSERVGEKNKIKTYCETHN